MGAAAAVDAGHIRIEDYVKVDACIKAYKMVAHKPEKLDAPRREIGMWIWGPPDAGKTSYILDRYPDAYEKEISKYWNGYQGEDIVFIDDIDKEHGFMKPFLKRWVQQKPFKAEDKYGGIYTIRPKKILVTSNCHYSEIFPGDAAIASRFENCLHLTEVQGKNFSF